MKKTAAIILVCLLVCTACSPVAQEEKEYLETAKVYLVPRVKTYPVNTTDITAYWVVDSSWQYTYAYGPHIFLWKDGQWASLISYEGVGNDVILSVDDGKPFDIDVMFDGVGLQKGYYKAQIMVRCLDNGREYEARCYFNVK